MRDAPLKEVNFILSGEHYWSVTLEELDVVQDLLDKLGLEVIPIDIGQNRRGGVISTFSDFDVVDCSASIGACCGDIGCDLVVFSFFGNFDLDLGLDVRSLIRDRVSRLFDADVGLKRADVFRQTFLEDACCCPIVLVFEVG